MSSSNNLYSKIGNLFGFEKKSNCCTDSHSYVYSELLARNKDWVQRKLSDDKDFFSRMKTQEPPFLFIGCSDSRMPIDTMTASDPGEIFVHRNIGNQVHATDINVLSVIEFAVRVLKTQSIIVGGHYRCGAVESAYYDNVDNGALRSWVNPIRDIIMDNKQQLDSMSTDQQKLNKISELNVIRQVESVFKTTVMQQQMKEAPRSVKIYGWIIDFESGLIKELNLPFNTWKEKGIVVENY